MSAVTAPFPDGTAAPQASSLPGPDCALQSSGSGSGPVKPLFLWHLGVPVGGLDSARCECHPDPRGCGGEAQWPQEPRTSEALVHGGEDESQHGEGDEANGHLYLVSAWESAGKSCQLQAGSRQQSATLKTFD